MRLTLRPLIGQKAARVSGGREIERERERFYLYIVHAIVYVSMAIYHVYIYIYPYILIHLICVSLRNVCKYLKINIHV